MGEYYWYRWLCGGMWVVSLGRWRRVLPEWHDEAQRMMVSKHLNIEDHRYFRSKQ